MSLPEFLQSISQEPLKVIDPSISLKDYIPLDLSIHNSELQTIDVSSSSELQYYVSQHVDNNNAKVAYGGYLEQRGIYDRSDYFNQNNPETERNIHLGLDLWIDAGTSVHAVLDGTIHSLKNNTNYGDYGPTIILKHQVKSISFYSLYGHLSLESLEGKEIGQSVVQGEQIATLGLPEVNGDYPPHLHFQIIKDLQGNFGDYPGVSSKQDLDFYKVNCPDPNLLLKLG
ncbi:peptidoglycan DD-metalloendopeptidase family protein [Winogradskyella sp. 3972H.M.0a.05]|uniref:peptidoglycan DD-metalloendopeptidase family protein n=1 Tax=Winogradskyella sp. 3972H.M.0a.05 TaxID=2950277 RepID=UPI003390ECE6